MREILLILIILLCILIPLSVYAEASMNYWEDVNYLSNNPEINESLNTTIQQFKDIPTIKYDIDLGRKENKVSC